MKIKTQENILLTFAIVSLLSMGVGFAMGFLSYYEFVGIFFAIFILTFISFFLTILVFWVKDI